jgi:hypothetical protein
MALEATKLRGCLRLLAQFKPSPNSFTGSAAGRDWTFVAIKLLYCLRLLGNVKLAKKTFTHPVEERGLAVAASDFSPAFDCFGPPTL